MAGCFFGITTDINLGDVYALAGGGYGVIDAPAELKIGIADEETYQENQAEFDDIISKYFGPIQQTRVEEEDLQSYLIASVNVPLIGWGAAVPAGLPIISFSVAPQAESVECLMRFDRDRFADMSAEIEQIFEQSVTVEDLSLAVVLRNDLGWSTVFRNRLGMYIDGEPCPYTELHYLSAGGEAYLLLPDVARDYLGGHGEGVIFDLLR